MTSLSQPRRNGASAYRGVGRGGAKATQTGEAQWVSGGDRVGELFLPKSTGHPERAIAVGVEEGHWQEWWPLAEDAVIPQPSPRTGIQGNEHPQTLPLPISYPLPMTPMG